MKTRIERAQSFLKGLDALMFTDGHDIRYLTGFTGGEAIFVLSGRERLLFTDSRYTLQAKAETQDIEVIEVARIWEDVYNRIRPLGFESMGVESHVMDVDTYIEVKDIFEGIELTPLGKQLKTLRIVKDGAEIECLKKAALIAEEALEETLQQGLVGRTEAAVSFAFECAMRTRGASAVSFELIVAAGERGAMPHGVASSRIIGRNEAVVIDFGCIFEGYCSDETVTVFTGKPTDEFMDVYTRVREAQARAIAVLAPGKQGRDIDAIARRHLADKGYGRFFGHGLGHGVGLEVHEEPRLSPTSEAVMQAGMVVTVEPGVYLPDKFGVRLEDTLVLTDNSCQYITNIDKDQIRIID